ncbi:hypothetical protein DFH07DRAFT_1005732 [Mycena maculata]|uniref:Uncharacterized protein n=1 Tax=Mycena maculata TaxID=230809 RepID=A0AAD7NNX3_9AGAR|nr:hypothetical protein DFH07DRAFT_1005732 [Mycena maculata]
MNPLPWSRHFLGPRVHDSPSDNTERELKYAAGVHFTRRGLSPQAPVIAGAIFAAVGFILLSCLFWACMHHRKVARDQELGLDLRSRPFPVDLKPGRSGPQPIHVQPPSSIHIVLSPPTSTPVPHISSPRRPRKAPPPRLHITVPQTQRESGSTHRSSVVKSMRDRWHLPPISQGYGVGLMTREAAAPSPRATLAVPQTEKPEEPVRTRRSSVSKSILGHRWHLPPISQGYGVGLQSRAVTTPPPAQPHKEKEAGRTRRGSASRWHLPPISQGYGVGLMTREPSPYRR